MAKPKKVDPNKIIVSTPALPANVGLKSDNPFITPYTNSWDNFKNFASGAYDAAEKIYSGAKLLGGIYTGYKGLKSLYDIYKTQQNASYFKQPWLYSPHKKLPTFDASSVFGKPQQSSGSWSAAFNDLFYRGSDLYPIGGASLSSQAGGIPALNPNWEKPAHMLLSAHKNISNKKAWHHNPSTWGHLPKSPSLEPSLKGLNAFTDLGGMIKPQGRKPDISGLVFQSPTKYRGLASRK